MENLKVGDKVLWSGNYGKELYKEATIIKIEKTLDQDLKYGFPVKEIKWDELRNCVVELSNGKWAYGYQLKPFYDIEN